MAMAPCPPHSAKGAIPPPSDGSGVKGAKRRRRREPLMPLPTGGKLEKPRAGRFQRVTAPRAVTRRSEPSAAQRRYTECAGERRGQPRRPTLCALLSAPYSLRPTLSALLSAPYSLRPTLYALLSTPYSLHPSHREANLRTNGACPPVTLWPIRAASQKYIA